MHPRSPYTRVDALRSTRRVRVELEGVVLAESAATVMVFETGLPTRYYFDRTAVHYSHLVPTDTVTACPYKGVTSAYWSARVGDEVHPDLAWAYDFPTRQLLPIAGLVAFYNEEVDLSIDGERLERPVTHFSRSPREAPREQFHRGRRRERLMSAAPRRIVTGHDASGRSVVLSDAPTPKTLDIGTAAFHEIWITDQTPAPIAATEPEPTERPVRTPPPPKE